MPGRSYIGIDITDNNQWIAVMWDNEHIILFGLFKNTPADLNALVHLITKRCTKPKICIKPADSDVLKLIKFIYSIPDVEVLLLSDAGLKMQCARLPKAKANAALLKRDETYQAYLLACCAQGMI